MAYISYFEKYKLYFDSLDGQESIVSSSKTLLNNCINNARTIKNDYFKMAMENKWQEFGKDIFINQIMLSLNNQIDKLKNFIEQNLCQACALSINTLLANLRIIKNEDEKLKIMYDELETLIGEYNKTPRYIDKWYKKYDENGNFKLIHDKDENPRYAELQKAINDKNLDIDSKEVYIKKLCN